MTPSEYSFIYTTWHLCGNWYWIRYRPGSCTSELQLKVNCRPKVICRVKLLLARPKMSDQPKFFPTIHFQSTIHIQLHVHDPAHSSTSKKRRNKLCWSTPSARVYYTQVLSTQCFLFRHSLWKKFCLLASATLSEPIPSISYMYQKVY